MILCQGETKNILMCDIDDRHSKDVFEPKGTHAVYLTPNRQ